MLVWGTYNTVMLFATSIKYFLKKHTQLLCVYISNHYIFAFLHLLRLQH